MARIWGFDLGTTSVGFAVVDHDEAREDGRVFRLGVRIFPEGVEASGGGSTKAPPNQRRRAARLLRRQLRRRRRRRQDLGRTLQEAGLRAQTGADAGLAAIASRVRSGDPDNLEARAAQRYWPALLGPAFRRHRGGPPPNNWLNYGYMALRAATARALCAAGLLPTLGIHHHHRNNPFCLADDLMAAYRPYVDLKVHGLVQAGPAADEIDRGIKRELLGVFNDVVPIAGQRTPLLLALHRSAASLVEAFVSGAPRLALPEGLPVEPDDDGERSAA